MKAILIDAENKNVREVECNCLEDWQTFVGGSHDKVYVEKCSQRWLPGHALLVDEEARVRTRQNCGFRLNGGSNMNGADLIIGNALVMLDTMPNFSAPTISLGQIQAMVLWVDDPLGGGSVSPDGSRRGGPR